MRLLVFEGAISVIALLVVVDAVLLLSGADASPAVVAGRMLGAACSC
ncbi:hypothetical protein [Nocardia alni]|nr:hypothetical protein [Nocardia alni]